MDTGLPVNNLAMVEIALAILVWAVAGYFLARPSNKKYK